MDALFLELLNRSLAASWLVLAVLLLRPLTKKAPKNLRCLLWGLAALRLLLPARLKSPWSLIPAAAPIAVAPGAAPTVQSGFAAVDAAINPALAGSLSPVPTASADPARIWLHIGAVVWLLGLAVMLLYALGSFALLRRRVSDAVLFHDNIYLSDKIDSPFVLGILFPRIYLPFGMTEENLALVLAHEQGHLARHDHWWKPLGFALLGLTWFNPLSWLAYVLFCKDIELACDEHVLSVLGPEARKPYSRTLLDCSVQHRRIAACPLAFGESDAKSRIKNVLSWKKPTVWVLLAGVVLCAVLAVCFLTDPADKAETSASAQEEQLGAAEQQALLSQQVTMLEPKNAIALSELFGLPDEQLVSVTIPPEAQGILETDTDAAGRQMLRALSSKGNAPFSVAAEYTMDDGSVYRFTAQVATASWTFPMEPGEEAAIADVFGMPGGRYDSIVLPPEAAGVLETFTDAEGTPGLRALAVSDTVLELSAVYYEDGSDQGLPMAAHVIVTADAAHPHVSVPPRESRVITELVVGRAYSAADLFGLPDEKYSGMRVTHDSDFKIEPFTGEDGRLMLRALAPSDAPFELIGEYFAEGGNTVTEIPVLVQTVRGTMMAESAGENDPARSLEIRFYEHPLDEFTLHVGDEPVELYAYNAAGERVMASWSANSDAVALSASKEDGGITVTPKHPAPDGVILLAYTDDGLGGSVKIYLPDSDAGLEIRYYEKPLDEFTVRVGDEPVELYAVDLRSGERVQAEWFVSDEKSLTLEMREHEHCAVIPKAAAAGGVTLTAKCNGVTRSVTVYVLPG